MGFGVKSCRRAVQAANKKWLGLGGGSRRCHPLRRAVVDTLEQRVMLSAYLLKDINATPPPPLGPANLTDVQWQSPGAAGNTINTTYFTAEDPQNLGQQALFRIDNYGATTDYVATNVVVGFPSGPLASSPPVIASGPLLFFIENNDSTGSPVPQLMVDDPSVSENSMGQSVTAIAASASVVNSGGSTITVSPVQFLGWVVVGGNASGAGDLFFAADDGDGSEGLWVVDGTYPARLITEFTPIPGAAGANPQDSLITSLTAFNGYGNLVVQAADSSGLQGLYYFDGLSLTGITSDGFDASGFTEGIVNGNDSLAFLNYNGSTGQKEVWDYDPAANFYQAQLVTSNAGPSPSIAIADGYLYYTEATGGTPELYATDGTTPAPVLDDNSNPISYPGNLTPIGTGLYFTVGLSGSNSSTPFDQVWDTDSTNLASGSGNPLTATEQVAALYPVATGVQQFTGFFAAGVSANGPGSIANLAGVNTVFAVDVDGTSTLYTIDNVFDNNIIQQPLPDFPTMMVQGIYASGAQYDVGDYVYFSDGNTINDTTGDGTFGQLSGSSGLSQISDLSAVANASPSSTTLYFFATDGAHGNEVFNFAPNNELDPSGDNAVVLVDELAPEGDSSNPYGFASVGSEVFFFASATGSSYDLWASDGTTANTVDLGSFNSSNIVAFNGAAYFNNGAQLWKSNGTPSGTVMVASGFSADISQISVVNGKLFIVGYALVGGDVDLWTFDGTNVSSPDTLVANGSGLEIDKFIAASDSAYYFLVSYSGTGNLQLWSTNGVNNNQIPFSIPVGQVNDGGATPIANDLYFSANDGTDGMQIWKAEAPSDTATMVTDLADGVESSQLLAVYGELYFEAPYTPAGTTTSYDAFYVLPPDGQATPIFVSNFLASPGGYAGFINDNMAGLNGRVYFEGENSSGFALWDYNPNTGVTGFDVSLNGGQYLTFAGADTLILLTDPPAGDGKQLFYSNGTSAGTVEIPLSESGVNWNQITDLYAFGNYVIFSGDDGAHGYEPWVITDPVATILAINTAAAPAVAALGTPITDQAAVSGGDNPSGTVTFNLYNNATASGTPLFTDMQTLSNGTATSDPYMPTTTGTDYWVATYSGDSNNASVGSDYAAEPVTITPATPTMTSPYLAFALPAPTTTSAGTAFATFKVDVVNANGTLITGTSGDAVSTVTITAPGLTLTGNSVKAINGVATFANLKTTKAGAFTLSATDSDGSVMTAQTGVSVAPGAPAKVVTVGTEPTTGTAGTALTPSLVLQLEDTYGNPETGDSTSTMTLSVKSGPGTPGWSGITAPVVNGVATFNSLVIDAAGTYVLTATDSSGASGNTGGIRIIASSMVSSLQFAGMEPTTGTAGVAVPLSVLALDAYGNPVEEDTITFTATGPANAADPTVRTGHSITTPSGMADIGIVSDVAGNYTFAISAADGVSIPSFVVTISPAAAAKVVPVGTEPTTGTAGTALTPSLVLGLYDTFGNLETGDSTSTMTLSVKSGPGTPGWSGITARVVNGVATINSLVIDAAGTYVLTATDTSGASGNTGGIRISASSVVNSLQFVGSLPTTGTAGVAVPLSVLALDAYGNPVEEDTITFTTTGPANATDPTVRTGRSITTPSGMADIGIVSDAAGNYTFAISAADGVSIPTFVVSINPAAAAKVAPVATEPTTGTAGTALTPSLVLGLYDTFGNLETGDSTTTLSLSVKSGPATPGWSGMTVPVVNGVATFNSLVIDTAGTYVLTGTDTSGVSGNTGSIRISASSVVSSLQFVGMEPTTGTAGVAVPLSVDAFDAYGNLVDDAIITFTFTGPTTDPTVSTGKASTGGTGEASIGKSFDIVGMYSIAISAADGVSLTPFAVTISPNVTAYKVVPMGTEPTTGMAGNALAPALILGVYDMFGNLETGDSTSTMTLSVKSTTNPTTPLMWSGITAPVVNGVATFSDLVIDTAAIYVLTASTSGVSGNTGSIKIIASSVVNSLQFVGTEPTTGTAGVAVPLEVLALDAYGNPIEDAPITFTITGPGTDRIGKATTGGTGMASIGEVLDATGSYMFAITAAGGASIPTFVVVISPAVAEYVEFVSPTAVTGTAGSVVATPLVADLVDAYGNLETADSMSSLSLSVKTGPANPGWTGMTTMVSNGVATFKDLVIDTAGRYILTTIDNSSGSVTAYNTATVQISASTVVSSLQFVGSLPTTGTAGVAVPLSVLALDAYGNPVGDDTITFTATGPTTATDPTVHTGHSITTPSGMASIGIVSDVAGNYTFAISASDGVSIPSFPVSISPGPAAKLVLVPPSGAIIGTPISAYVFVYDSVGNITTLADTDSITLALVTHPAGSTLTGGGPVVISNGMVVFTGLIFSTKGNYTIQATMTMTGAIAPLLTSTPSAVISVIA